MRKKRVKNRKSRNSTTRRRMNTPRQNKATNLINLFARLVDYLMDDNNRLKKALHLKYLNRHSGLTFGGTSSRHSRTHDK